MTTEVTEKMVSLKRRMLFAMPFVLALVGMASALDLNATIGPILDGIVELIPTLLNLILAMVPIIIVMAIVSFIVTFLDKILGMLKL
jgi:hypothetical protein